MEYHNADEPIYVISVAARLLEVHPQTLRYYERVGLLKPTRSTGKIRLYSQREIERLRKVMRLTSELGVNLAGAEVIIDLTERLEQVQKLSKQREEQLLAEIDALRKELKNNHAQASRSSVDDSHLR